VEDFEAACRGSQTASGTALYASPSARILCVLTASSTAWAAWRTAAAAGKDMTGTQSEPRFKRRVAAASVSTEMALALKGRPTQAKRPIDRHVGERLRAIRESRHLSLQAMADSMGIDVVRLRAFEAGERLKPEVLYGIAQALGVLIAEFFVATKAPEPQDPPVDELAAFESPETTALLQVWRRLEPVDRHRAILAVRAVAGE
jgi:transcriptional regulator with XRE-family HTH domain